MRKKRHKESLQLVYRLLTNTRDITQLWRTRQLTIHHISISIHTVCFFFNIYKVRQYIELGSVFNSTARTIRGFYLRRGTGNVSYFYHYKTGRNIENIRIKYGEPTTNYPEQVVCWVFSISSETCYGITKLSVCYRASFLNKVYTY